MTVQKDHIENTMPTAKMTEAMIANMRSRIGTVLRIDDGINNEESTNSSVIRFVEGIGDGNPLWVDRGYAATAFAGAPIAPPSWVMCCFSGAQFGWPGLGAFHSASRFRFFRIVRRGDRVRPRMTYLGFDGPRPSKFAGQAVTDKFLIEYHNQNGDLVCETDMEIVHYERGEGQRRASDRARFPLPHPWTAPELHDLEEEVLAEAPRGSTRRWWEDVEAGEVMEGILKGPISLTDEVAFVASGAAPIPRLSAHGTALRRYRQRPKWAYRDPDTRALEPIYSVHYNANAARQMGIPLPYDVGVQRSCWHIHMLTNWMGDDGWLQEISHEFRGFVYLGDIVRFSGRVTGKSRTPEGRCLVRVETSAINQRGENVMPGRALVQLPSRENPEHPLAGK